MKPGYVGIGLMGKPNSRSQFRPAALIELLNAPISPTPSNPAAVSKMIRRRTMSFRRGSFYEAGGLRRAQ